MDSKLSPSEEISPALSGKLPTVLFIANFTIAATWVYHGVFPKLLYMETGELSMVSASGIFKGIEREAVYTIGAAEVIFGLAFIFFGRLRILHWLNISALIILGIGAAIVQPDIYIYPFNPATTAFGIMGLSTIMLMIGKYIPDKNIRTNKNVHL